MAKDTPKEKITKTADGKKIIERYEKDENGQTIKITEIITEKKSVKKDTTSEDAPKTKKAKTDTKNEKVVEPKVEKAETQASDELTSNEKIMNIITNKKFLIATGGVIIFLLILLLVISSMNKPKINYTVSKVEKGTIYSAIQSEGRLESSTLTNIISKVASTVTKVNYTKGQEIKEGALLVEFDTQYANDAVKQYETAITSVKNMQQLYNTKKDELTVKASNDGFLKDMIITTEKYVNPGDIIGYMIPTTTFRAIYNVTYTPEKKIQNWQTVKITYPGGTVEGLVYDISGELVDGAIIKVGVYVTDSEINLSGVTTTAEIITPTGSVLSNEPTNFLTTTPMAIYAKQSGTIKANEKINDKKIKKDEVICTIINEDITNKINELDAKLLELQKSSDFQKFDLNNYKVYSTVDGTVESEPIQVGESVTPNKQLLTIKTANKINVEVKVTKEDLDKIKIDQEVIMTVKDGETTKAVKGKVIDMEVYSITDTNEKYTVTITVNKEEADSTLIDKNAIVEIVLEKKEKTMFVPIKAVYKEASNYFVDVDKNGTKEKRSVTIGIQNATSVEIVDGLKEEETVRVYN